MEETTSTFYIKHCKVSKCVPFLGKPGQCNRHTVSTLKAETSADPVIGWSPRYVCVSGSGARSSLTGGKYFQGLQGSWRCVPTALNASRDLAPGGRALAWRSRQTQSWTWTVSCGIMYGFSDPKRWGPQSQSPWLGEADIPHYLS